jgi:hypothetical protein
MIELLFGLIFGGLLGFFACSLAGSKKPRIEKNLPLPLAEAARLKIEAAIENNKAQAEEQNNPAVEIEMPISLAESVRRKIAESQKGKS